MPLNQKSISKFWTEWHKFKTLVLENKNIETLNCKILNEPKFEPKSGTSDNVDFEVLLKFIDVPCRATQSKCRNLDIYLQSRITYKIISPNEKQILQYSTSVQYCKKNDKTLRCIMGYRYDGNDVTLQYGHPIFHMHFKNDVLFEVIREVEQNKFDVSELDRSDERDEVKIPTAQMDFFNAIVGLFADHLYTDENKLTKNATLGKFKLFLEKIDSLLIPCNTVQTKLFGNGPQTESCLSNRWYPIDI